MTLYIYHSSGMVLRLMLLPIRCLFCSSSFCAPPFCYWQRALCVNPRFQNEQCYTSVSQSPSNGFILSFLTRYSNLQYVLIAIVRSLTWLQTLIFFSIYKLIEFINLTCSISFSCLLLKPGRRTSIREEP